VASAPNGSAQGDSVAGEDLFMTPESQIHDPRAEAKTADLVREAIDEAKELMKIEVALAKDEVLGEVRAAKKTAIAFSAAAVLAIEAIAMLLVALALEIHVGPAPALIIAVMLLLSSGAAAYFGWRTIPKKPLDRTQKRVKTDVQILKERVA
jgi:hypothetical protein